jgi:acetyl-CoA carboxylase biotin carboxyl carrier protein
MSLLPEDVQDVLSLLDTLPYDEVDLETSELRVALRRAGGGWTQESQVLSSPNLVHTQVEDTAGDAPEAGIGPAGATREGLVEVRSPLPGTFYRAPKPGAPPYVEVGSRVEADTVIGLVETMKLFNSVYAQVRGRVVEFLVSDAEFAPKDTVLVVIEPDED